MTELKLKKVSLKRVLAVILAMCLSISSAGMNVSAAPNVLIGQEGATPGQGEATPGQGEATPGQGEATPGQGEATPGQGEATPGQGEATPGQGTKAENVSLDQSEKSLEVGSEFTLIATVLPSGAVQDVTWSTSNEAVATVVGGKVTAVSAGTATITATVASNGELAATCVVTVTEAPKEATPAEGIELSEVDKELEVGSEFTLTATVLPAEAEQAVIWSTSDEAVATVVDGKVTAVAVGTATITAAVASNGELTATCVVTVVAAPIPVVEVTGVTVKPASLALKAGQSEVLTATVAPADATDKSLTWASSNDNVATVAANGIVTAKANGTATITATTVNGKTATSQVTVTTDVTGVALSSKAVTIAVGKTTTLTATVAPATASNKTVTFATSDAKVATVNAAGVVTGKASGTATITATTANGKTATATVTVASVTLNAKSATLQAGKSTTALKVATKFPSNDTVASWTSSNTKVATVNSSGKITATKTAGKTTITVTMKSGATASATITVQKKAVTTKSLSISEKKVTLQKGKTTTLSVARNPITATEKITWTSSNTKVATVNNKGKVTAKSAGTATITAKTSNGKKVTAKITVKNPTVKLKKSSATVKVGKTTTIAIKSMYPATDSVKSFKSSNSKVASVNKNGVVTGKKKGTATITVTMKSGAKATFKVTVKK
ncbi:Ig-like domain-containing protein [Konateibacter massiliensis]|uniref:Ig-like domain-containing protein n=1 Tax=Konateibacter massiliensis TaxID=2002841 RepID=UPI000C1468CA|nr:Ig-like domain-containing protein [Konateibacter massiliensis]